MNNQLRKIVEQAVSAVDIVTGNEALDDELAKMYIPDCFAEKFAELIVRECAEHALTFNNNLQSLNDKEIRSHSSRVSDYIKDCMGVEQ